MTNNALERSYMVDYVGQRLGNYQLTRLLGEGGFAQVYLGEHIYLGTEAAIKVLNTQLVDDQDWFRTEARTIARLVHPNIVRVLEFGLEGNTPFLVMDYAPRGTLRQRHPKGSLLTLPTIIPYVKQVAAALEYAHGQKLIHRDIKPENMLVGRNDEILLSDFGIALMSQTMNGQNVQNVAGTLPYMAPEQLRGYPRRASDQYSLGIVVYEWLSGMRPFDGSFTEVISQQLSTVPQPLRTKMPQITPAVEQVVMTALEKDPDKRFNSIQAFTLALEQASQVPVPVAISPAPATASPPPPPLSTRPPFPPVNQAAPAPSSLPPHSARVEQARPAGTPVASYTGHADAIRSLSWMSDGKRIVSASNDKTVHVWDAMTGKQQQIYQDASDVVLVVAASPDGSRIATAGSDGAIRVWDFATNHLLTTYLGHQGQTIKAMAWSPQQSLLASTATDATVHVWDVTTGQAITIYRGHSESINSLAWSPYALSSDSGRSYHIVSGGDDSSVHCWDAATGKTVALYRDQPGKILGVAWSPSIYVLDKASPNVTSSRVGCGREDGMVQMWDTSINRQVLSYRYPAPISVVAWSPNGRRFAYASDDTSIEIWDTTSNLKLLTFSHAAPPHAMAWSPDGTYIASGGDDRQIQVWIAP